MLKDSTHKMEGQPSKKEESWVLAGYIHIYLLNKHMCKKMPPTGKRKPYLNSWVFENKPPKQPTLFFRAIRPKELVFFKDYLRDDVINMSKIIQVSKGMYLCSYMNDRFV